jgi:FkbM family methyltransferase
MRYLINKLYRGLVHLYLLNLPFRIQGFWMFTHPENIGIARFLWKQDYENFSSETLKKTVKKGWRVVDLGAHVGYFSLLMSRLVGDSGRVYAFEPDPFCVKILERNIRMNGYQNIIVETLAISDKQSKAKLYFSEDDPTDHRLFNPKSEKRSSLTVSQDTLDNYFGENKIDLIKIDVQGLEMKCLKGAKKVISNNSQLVLLIEFWPNGLVEAGYKPIELLNYLKRLGYKMYWIDEYKNTKKLVADFSELIKIAQAKQFVNLFCQK